MLAVELADFQRCAGFGVSHVNSGKSNVLAKDGRADRGSNLADLRPPVMQAIAVADIDVGVNL